MGELTHISLFTGIGGIDLAAEWAGFKTILFVEIDKYCQKVLNKHWPDVPLIGDIKDVTKERIQAITATREEAIQLLINGLPGKSYKKPIANATIQRPHNQENKQELEGEGGNELHSEQPRDTEAMAYTASQRINGVNGDNREATTEDRFRDDKSDSRSNKSEDRANQSVKPITLITGGFPCQPVSQAGKRKGKEDDRWLWPEMLRVIRDVRPTWVVAENVGGLTSMVEWDSALEVDIKEYTKEEMAACLLDMGEVRERTGRGSLDEILESLEAEGYKVKPFLLPACAVNAPHRRDRIFIVAHTLNNGHSQEEQRIFSQEAGMEEQDRPPDSPSGESNRASFSGESDRLEEVSAMADANRERPQGRVSKELRECSGQCTTGESSSPLANTQCQYGHERENEECRERWDKSPCPDSGKSSASWWAVEPELGMLADGVSPRVGRYNPHHYDREPDIPRVTKGVPNRVAQLKAYGNAVDPMQIYPILKAIADIENTMERRL